MTQITQTCYRAEDVAEVRISPMRALAIVFLAAAFGCREAPATVFERLSEARQLTAETFVQFTKAADASNRAVMAGTDEAAATFVREGEDANSAVQTSIDQLRSVLKLLDYSKESQLLDEFAGRFAEYRALDRNILEMVAESSNLKAQRLSFGGAWQEADALRDALHSIPPLVSASDRPRVEALVAIALLSVREIQALQAPHIAEPNDAPMTRLEKRMADSQETARRALQTLAGSVPSAAQPQVKAATAALDRFLAINTQILTLSRRNTNVNALALSLGQKRTLVAACEESLRALGDALARRGFTGTR